MKTFVIFLMALTLCAFTGQASAKYNANMRGIVKNVLVYTDGDYIYFRLDNQPTSHPTCGHDFFVISETVSHERRQMLLSRLLSAYAMKENVNIGYDSQGDCANGYIRVHRVG
jgi:hypothetical protein